MDLGRPPLARFPSGDLKLSSNVITQEDLAYAIEKVLICLNSFKISSQHHGVQGCCSSILLLLSACSPTRSNSLVPYLLLLMGFWASDLGCG